MAADAERSAAPELDGPALDGLRSDDSQLAGRVAVPPEAEPCTPDAALSVARSSAVPELRGAEALLVVSARELAARLAEQCWPAQQELMALEPQDLSVTPAQPRAALQVERLQPEQPAWGPLAE